MPELPSQSENSRNPNTVATVVETNSNSADDEESLNVCDDCLDPAIATVQAAIPDDDMLCIVSKTGFSVWTKASVMLKCKCCGDTDPYSKWIESKPEIELKPSSGPSSQCASPGASAIQECEKS